MILRKLSVPINVLATEVRCLKVIVKVASSNVELAKEKLLILLTKLIVDVDGKVISK